MTCAFISVSLGLVWLSKCSNGIEECCTSGVYGIRSQAEATVVAYKQRLDAVGSMNQQKEDLEDQAEKYLQQIMELEAEVKKSTSLQRTVTSQETKIAKLEKELEAGEKSIEADKSTTITIEPRFRGAYLASPILR